MSQIHKVVGTMLFFVFLISSCSTPTPAEVQPPLPTSPEEQVSETDIEIVESVPTETAEEILPTADDIAPEVQTNNQDDLIEVWYSPIASSVLVYGICETLNEMIAAGELESDSFGTALVVGLLIEAVRTSIADWEPEAEFEEYQSATISFLDDIQGLAAQWVQDEIDADQFNKDITNVCEEIETYSTSVVDDAKEAGINDASLEYIAEELASAFEEMGEENIGEESGEEETITVSSEIGHSRANPLPSGEMHSVPNWNMQVVESIRGDEAWSLIQSANSYNEPPSEGNEYVLIKVAAENMWDAEDETYLDSSDFNLTGDRLISYTSASVVEPEPELDATLFPGGTAEGWLSFEVGIQEGNLILIFDELENWDDDRFRYIAVDENASINISDELSEIQPNEPGKSRQDPAPFGETVITDDWEITVLEVMRGDQAWALLEEANSYNEPPGEGMEYVLAKLNIRYIKPVEGAVSLTNNTYDLTGSNGTVYENPYVVEPSPDMDISLFPGGEYIGWVGLQTANDDSNLMLMFNSLFDWDNENRRFLSLEP